MADGDLIARVRAARGYANLSQAGLAELLEVSPATVKRMEDGSRPITQPEQRAIADATGVPREFIDQGWVLNGGAVTREWVLERLEELRLELTAPDEQAAQIAREEERSMREHSQAARTTPADAQPGSQGR